MRRWFPWFALTAVLACATPAGRLTSCDERNLSRQGARTWTRLLGEPIAFQLDVPYADDGNPKHRLDVYLPEERAAGRLPAIVYFHGGGWFEGDKADGLGRLLPFVRTGRYAGFSAAYRFTDEATWPAQLHDAKAAIRWVRANAVRYGVDPDRIGVWGWSAGGHLALALGTTGDVPALEGGVGPSAGASSAVAAVVNFFGIWELPAIPPQPPGNGPTLDELASRLIGGPLVQRRDGATAASPATYLSPGDPPVLTVHGTEDAIVPYDQALRVDEALRRAGVPTTLVTVPGGGHGDFGRIADGNVEAFFERYLRRREVEVPAEPVAFGAATEGR